MESVMKKIKLINPFTLDQFTWVTQDDLADVDHVLIDIHGNLNVSFDDAHCASPTGQQKVLDNV
jgi:hypothetical protein